MVFFSDKYHDRWEYVASRRMFDLAGVKYWQHIPAQRQIVIDFDDINEELLQEEEKDPNNASSGSDQTNS